MTSATDKHVKVLFSLQQDEDGWPPVTTEGVWAVQLGEDLVRIDNAPWFVPDVACGDVVRINKDVDGELRAVAKIKSSGNCTIRVIPLKDGRFEGELAAVIQMFTSLGVTGEGLGQIGIIALNVPTDIDLTAVKGVLRQGSDEGWWDFEEGCVGDAWAAVHPE